MVVRAPSTSLCVCSFVAFVTINKMSMTDLVRVCLILRLSFRPKRSNTEDYIQRFTTETGTEGRGGGRGRGEGGGVKQPLHGKSGDEPTPECPPTKRPHEIAVGALDASTNSVMSSSSGASASSAIHSLSASPRDNPKPTEGATPPPFSAETAALARWR